MIVTYVVVWLTIMVLLTGLYVVVAHIQGQIAGLLHVFDAQKQRRCFVLEPDLQVGISLFENF